MACSFPDNKWCGRWSCADHDGDNSGTDGDLNKIIRCPPNYLFVGWKRFDRGILRKDQYLRRCIRVATGSEMNCATGQVDSKICPNEYCTPNAPASIALMTKHCNEGNRIFDDSYCKKWKMEKPTRFRDIIKSKCNMLGNINRLECQEFCRNNPGECPGLVDTCSVYPDNPLCTCLNSPLNEINMEGAPPAACFDNKCIGTGYMSSNMERVSKNCPNYINCKQMIHAEPGAVLNNVNIRQKCSVEIANDKKDKAKAAKKAAEDKAKAAKKAAEDKAKAAKKAAEDKAKALKRSKMPEWQKKYEDIVSKDPLKQIVDNINETVPDINFEISGVELDDVKPLLVLFLIIIVLIMVSNENMKEQQPVPYYNSSYY